MTLGLTEETAMISGKHFIKFIIRYKSIIYVRTIEIERDVIQTTNGSTRVRIGSTEILVGVKAELEKPELKTPSQGKSE